MNLMVTTDPKPIIDIQKIKRKKANNTTETNQSQRKKAREEERNRELQKEPENK